jgi:protein translocase SecG subunit
VRDVILYLVLLVNVISMVGMVAGILMHSGRGGGLSDMFGGGGGAALGSSAAERNLRLRADVDPLGPRPDVLVAADLADRAPPPVDSVAHVGVAEWQTR